MIQVHLPSQLESYTGGVRELSIDPASLPGKAGAPRTLMDVIRALDERYRGLAFRIVDEQDRIRRHIAIFVSDQMVRRLDEPLEYDARVQIVGALSGG